MSNAYEWWVMSKCMSDEYCVLVTSNVYAWWVMCTNDEYKWYVMCINDGWYVWMMSNVHANVMCMPMPCSLRMHKIQWRIDYISSVCVITSVCVIVSGVHKWWVMCMLWGGYD